MIFSTLRSPSSASNQSLKELHVNAINDVEFQVIDGRKQFMEQLDCISCTYCVWDLDEIPCAHALAVLRGRNINTYYFVSKYFFCSGSVRLVGNHANWKSIEVDMNILPPPFKRRARTTTKTKNTIKC
uniref:Zinc finger PMZ-type domain-containing protein n=1 Tax=Cucumis melo TaxID=3656 RepID=A0A9I9EHG5_CUCME